MKSMIVTVYRNAARTSITAFARVTQSSSNVTKRLNQPNRERNKQCGIMLNLTRANSSFGAGRKSAWTALRTSSVMKCTVKLKNICYVQDCSQTDINDFVLVRV